MYDQVQIHFCMAHDLVPKTNTLMENGFLVLKHICPEKMINVPEKCRQLATVF